LEGDRVTTWTDTIADPPIFWLRDLLKHEIHNARILSYGYDPILFIDQFSNKKHVSEFAKELVQLRLESDTVRLPI
jgi:hypothetical protein